MLPNYRQLIDILLITISYENPRPENKKPWLLTIEDVFDLIITQNV